MSQLVAAASGSGLVLAADRRVVLAEKTGMHLLSVRKLFALGPEAAVATSGAAVGVATSRWAAAHLAGRTPLPFEDLAEWVHAEFQARYDAFVRRGEEWFAEHPEAHRLSYILLGGRRSDGTFAFHFEASEEPQEPYHLLATGRVLSAPRRMGLEARVLRLVQADATADELADAIGEGLRLIAQKEREAVASPFDLALLDGDGLRLRTID